MITYINDIVKITIKTNTVLSGYDCYIKYKKPNGDSGTWDASIVSGSNTHMTFTSSLGTFNIAGRWFIQPLATKSVGGTLVSRLHGKIVSILVKYPLS